ncbi:MAG: DUF2948 family protein [Pseudomonadota bacterium]
MEKPVRLVAFDADDLNVIGALVQDAITKPAAVEYDPKSARFSLLLNRFAWDAETKKSKRKKTHQRRQSALSFARVKGVQSTGVKRGDDSQALSLLALRFSGADAPAGTIEIVFSDGPAIRLDVECVEAQLADLGGAWETRFKPRHPA